MEPRAVAVLDGRRVREELDLVNLTQRQFAARLGLRESTISAAIRGKPLATETIYRIVLGLSLAKPRGAAGELPVFFGPAASRPRRKRAEAVDDRAQIFVGDVAEALADLEYSVIRDPALLAVAQAEMAAAMQRVIDSHRAASSSTVRRRKGRS